MDRQRKTSISPLFQSRGIIACSGVGQFCYFASFSYGWSSQIICWHNSCNSEKLEAYYAQKSIEDSWVQGFHQ